MGPVHGIVKEHEPNKGRIIIAARYTKQDPDKKVRGYSHVIYPDDNGENWSIGGALSLRSTESTVVELPNGDVMLNSRSLTEVSARTVGISKDGGTYF